MLFENDAAGIAGRDDYQKYFPEAGGTIVAQEPTQFGQTDYRPALLKLSSADPQVMLVSITAAQLQMAQQFKQLGAKFADRRHDLPADPSLVADPSSNGIVHTQIHIEAPPDLAAAFKKQFGADMEFFVRQYYNATQVVLTTLHKVLEEKKPVTGENMRTALFKIGTFKGLIPLEFKTNTATVGININKIENGKDVTIKQLTAD